MARPSRGADVLLKDGTIASIRTLEPDDAAALAALHERATAESLRLRFFSASPRAAQEYVEHLCRSHQTVALIATQREQVVGLATAEPLDPAQAEVSFLVDDSVHGRGLGTLLLEHLAAAARGRGITQFVAEVLAENHAMIRVFVDAGFSVSRHIDSNVVEVVMDTAASQRAVAAADVRDGLAEARSLHPLLYPRSVALTGVKRDGSGVGAAVLDSVLAGGFEGDVFVVHPTAEQMQGAQAFPSFSDLPRHVDLAVISVPAPAVMDALRDAAGAGIGAAVVISSGFEEMGEEGARLQREIVHIARDHSMRLVGPNCLGLMSNDPTVRLNATFCSVVPPSGGLAVASQSGGVGIVLLDLARELGLGVELFVSLGNKADVSSNDLLAAWLEDPRVTAAALYLESFGNAPKFARVARRFATRKPLLAVVGGRSAGGQRAGASHTAAAATPSVGVDALFAQAGVIACSGAEDLAETALLLAEQPLPGGGRVAILSNAGGMGVLAADVAEGCGLVVPELSAPLRSRLASHVTSTLGTGNPVDAGAAAAPQDLAAIADGLLASDEVDALLVVLVATTVTDVQPMLELVEHDPEEPRRTKPVLLVPMGGLHVEPGKIPGVTRFRSSSAALGALGRAARYAEWLAVPHEDAESQDVARARRVQERSLELLGTSETGRWLEPGEAVELLDGYDLAPQGETARDPVSAADTASRLGFPVAVKVTDRDIVHKTERGLVRVGLRSAAEVISAARSFEVELARKDVEVLVQPMASGVEVALGMVRDPVLGPLVMVAAGGVAIDVWDDRVFLMTPVPAADAGRAVRALRIWPLLAGHRGTPRGAIDSLEHLVVAVGHLADEVPQVAELDLNPVLVAPAGCALVDVNVRLAPPGGREDLATLRHLGV